jgi:hypothetical protein
MGLIIKKENARQAGYHTNFFTIARQAKAAVARWSLHYSYLAVTWPYTRFACSTARDVDGGAMRMTYGHTGAERVGATTILKLGGGGGKQLLHVC